jgi:hypothetical protein
MNLPLPIAPLEVGVRTTVLPRSKEPELCSSKISIAFWGQRMEIGTPVVESKQKPEELIQKVKVNLGEGQKRNVTEM